MFDISAHDNVDIADGPLLQSIALSISPRLRVGGTAMIQDGADVLRLIPQMDIGNGAGRSKEP